MLRKCLSSKKLGDLSQVEEQEATSLAQAVEILSDAIKKKQASSSLVQPCRDVLAGECSTEQVAWYPLTYLWERLMLDTRPAGATSQMERLVGYGQLLTKKTHRLVMF